MIEAAKNLFRSRKFLLALLAVVQTLVMHYFKIDPQVWGAIDALAVVVIGGIAYEDGQEKRSGIYADADWPEDDEPSAGDEAEADRLLGE